MSFVISIIFDVLFDGNEGRKEGINELIFQNNVDNFETAHKTSSILV